MSDEQLIVLAASVIFRHGNTPQSDCVRVARELFEENRKFGPMGYRCDWCKDTKAMQSNGKTADCPKCVTRKATLSHPTIQERNEAHAERQYSKRRGT